MTDDPSAASGLPHDQEPVDVGLVASYFDGRSARAWPVRLHSDGAALHIRGEGFDYAVPLHEVGWPERTRHGLRVAELPGGASLQCRDAAAWDAFAQASGGHDTLVVRAQQSWRWVFASVAAMGVLLAVFYLWGVPLAARAALVLIPESIDQSVGELTRESLDAYLMEPTKLPQSQQDALRAAFERALSHQPEGSVPTHHIEFRSSDIGPNAFALPGGTIMVTDELVEFVNGDERMVTGVLAHELGHVRERHGMRMVVQASAIGVLASVVLGDFNSLLATAPVMLGQAAYSRDAEREADEESARVMRAAGISPSVMATFFEKISTKKGEGDLGIAIASHPADEERIRFFREYP